MSGEDLKRLTADIKRTELIWPSKYGTGEQSVPKPRPALPFQVIERVNESRTAREAKVAKGLTLFDVFEGDSGDTFEAGWRNKLIWGENLPVTSSLLHSFSGKVDLVYIDPPFAVGADFSLKVPVGDAGLSVVKEQSVIEEKAYRDTWGADLDSYLAMMFERLSIIHQLLSANGSLYVHCDYRVNSHIRLILDEIFGSDRFQREIIWDVRVLSGFKTIANNWIRGHDTILFYTKSPAFTFNKQFGEHSPEYIARFNKTDEEGRRYFDGRGARRYLDDVIEKGKALGDVWDDIMSFQQTPTSAERLAYPTQKPEALLERIMLASSNEGDLVADFFCGSGTTLAVAEKLGRRWIGCDLGRFAVHTARKRLLDIEGCRPFEVLNLGKYERQYWRAATFGDDRDEDGSVSLLEYIAFILKLYGASPLSGSAFLHGQRCGAFVHVGAVDSPVTMQEVEEAVEACLALKGSELHLLGWEWEMGLNDTLTDRAKGMGVRLLLRQIPREVMEAQAAAKGDITFHELAYLRAQPKIGDAEREVTVELEDFVIPNPELLEEEVRQKIQKWSDYIDYWAVDWNFSDDSFMQGFVTYRTKQNRTLRLKSDAHVYEDPGSYSVLVKVVDIFGNDTSAIYQVDVS